MLPANTFSGRMARRLLRAWAQRRPAIPDPPALPLDDRPIDKADEVDRYCRAAAAAELKALDDLAAIVSEGRWQAPFSEPGAQTPELALFKQAGDDWLSRGNPGQAFALGTRVRDAQGSAMHDLVGTALRIKARMAGFASHDAPDEETLRATARAEIMRWAIPQAQAASAGADWPGVEQGSDLFHAHTYASRILFGGQENALDRADSVARLRDALDRMEGDVSNEALLRGIRENAPFAPMEVISFFGSPVAVLSWTAKRRVLPPRVRNPLGRMGVASIYNAIFIVKQAHHRERTIASGSPAF
jgi:hypothetical protein